MSRLKLKTNLFFEWKATKVSGLEQFQEEQTKFGLGSDHTEGSSIEK